MRLRSSSRPLVVLVLAIILTLIPGAAGARAKASAGPVTAVADIHGDFDHLVSLLQHCGLIDAQNHWAGDQATLVQTGDILDRGPKEHEALDLLMALEKEAPKKGGRVLVLLGNHEVMNIMGDLRYVAPPTYASFAGPDSEKLQHSAYQKYRHWREEHRALLATIPQEFPEISEAQWMALHPAGFLEQREAFGPDGKYGKWLRQRPAVLELNHIIFVHGGLDPNLTSISIEEMDRRVHDEISTFDKIMSILEAQQLVLPFFTLQETTAVVQAAVKLQQNAPGSLRSSPANPAGPTSAANLPMMEDFLQYGRWMCVASNGPLWFRGYAEWSDEQIAAQVPKVLAAYKATAIVAGHTPQRDGHIRSRLGGKLFLIDTGMLSSFYPQGRASALQISQGVNFTPEYLDQNLTPSESAKP